MIELNFDIMNKIAEYLDERTYRNFQMMNKESYKNIKRLYTCDGVVFTREKQDLIWKYLEWRTRKCIKEEFTLKQHKIKINGKFKTVIRANDIERFMDVSEDESKIIFGNIQMDYINKMVAKGNFRKTIPYIHQGIMIENEIINSSGFYDAFYNYALASAKMYDLVETPNNPYNGIMRRIIRQIYRDYSGISDNYLLWFDKGPCMHSIHEKKFKRCNNKSRCLSSAFFKYKT